MAAFGHSDFVSVMPRDHCKYLPLHTANTDSLLCQRLSIEPLHPDAECCSQPKNSQVYKTLFVLLKMELASDGMIFFFLFKN